MTMSSRHPTEISKMNTYISMYLADIKQTDLHNVPVLHTQRVQELLGLFSISIQNALVSVPSEVKTTEFLQMYRCTINGVQFDSVNIRNPHSRGQAAAS